MRHVSLLRLSHYVVILLLLSRGANAKEIGPKDELCAEINQLLPGEELVLQPGEYLGPCTISAGGAPDQPIVIRAKTLAARPHVTFTGGRGNVLTIRAGHIVLQGLALGPTLPGVDAVRLIVGEGIRIEDCLFEGIGGNVIASTHRGGQGLWILRNQIVDSRDEAIYLGCHDGSKCAVERLRIEANYIDGVDAPEKFTGYAIQVKLNSWGWIRDNVIVNTKGPGIMVYGANRPGRVNVIERNAVAGSRISAGIVLGGGPAVVRNNILSDNQESGIQLENYGQRGLLRNITIVHNTVYRNGAGGITVPSSGPLDRIRVFNNAVHVRPGTPAFPRVGRGIESAGNVNCGTALCFRDPGLRDFSPLLTSPLLRSGVFRAGAGMPADDFVGERRGPLPTVGAVEGPAPPIPIGFKRLAP